MDLKSGYPYWAVKNGLLRAYPALARDARCDVAVVGAGITGALIADELARHGHHVIVLDQRDVGWGSSSASTALIQYEIDTHMVDLAERYGEADAALAYQACATAIDDLAELADALRDVAFRRQASVYCASIAGDRPALEAELGLRAAHGFAVAWLERDALHERYGIAAPCAIHSALAASLDPFRMTYRLMARVVRAGGEVYDRTTIEDVAPHPRGVELRIAGGSCVRAKHVVVAAGYESERWLKQRVATNRSSYAFVTDPLGRDELGALARTLVWESARPYLYVRSTADGRLLVGGEDDAVDRPHRRDLQVDRKARRLVAKAARRFPGRALVPTFAWAGMFAETRDGLPYFGAHRERSPRIQFAMAYGGNGITYSMIGAGIIRATIERRRHPLAELFSFRRLSRSGR